VGLLLIVVPWSSYWQRNYFVQTWPSLWPYLDVDFVRGAVSGLGVLNLLAGFAELAPVFAPHDRDLGSLHEHDPEPSYRSNTRVEP